MAVAGLKDRYVKSQYVCEAGEGIRMLMVSIFNDIAEHAEMDKIDGADGQSRLLNILREDFLKKLLQEALELVNTVHRELKD